MGTLVTFGELMMRLTPPHGQRIVQSQCFDITFAGAEANVAVAFAGLGHTARLVTSLPDNSLGELALRTLNFWGIETSCVTRAGHRMPLYYLESGALQRPGRVIYDRKASPVALAEPAGYNWRELLAGADWFHVSGITPALSRESAQATMEALAAAESLGVRRSFDLNYRRTLWSPEAASQAIAPLLQNLDLLIAGCGDLQELFHFQEQDPESLALAVAGKYQIARVLIPHRCSTQSGIEQRSALMVAGNQIFRSRTFDMEMREPLGGGDALAGALLAMLVESRPPQEALDFSVAAAALKHSIPGDFQKASREEISQLIPGSMPGIQR